MQDLVLVDGKARGNHRSTCFHGELERHLHNAVVIASEDTVTYFSSVNLCTGSNRYCRFESAQKRSFLC
jgi:hypothetical protein